MEKYYVFASLTVAMRTMTDGTDTLQWLLADHLGSTSVTASDDGTLNSILKYSAFGEIWASSGTTLTDYRYTNQLSQSEIGLYYYNARWYDPQLGRFIQADTIVPGAGNAGAWDRYAYVLNNPIKLTDPSGHTFCDGGKCKKPSPRKPSSNPYFDSSSITNTNPSVTPRTISSITSTPDYLRFLTKNPTLTFTSIPNSGMIKNSQLNANPTPTSTPSPQVSSLIVTPSTVSTPTNWISTPTKGFDDSVEQTDKIKKFIDSQLDISNPPETYPYDFVDLLPDFPDSTYQTIKEVLRLVPLIYTIIKYFSDIPNIPFSLPEPVPYHP